ncbi:hypothetical protein Lal_00037915 [Lupinus albus]|nr:hypothetical protein Lal_00037915 [Lupinus albus]
MRDRKLSKPNDSCGEYQAPTQTYNIIIRINNFFNIVDQINEYVLIKFEVYFIKFSLNINENEYLTSYLIDMSDANENEAFNILTHEFLNSLATSDLPNHKIKLKVKTSIMLLRNLHHYE